MSALPTDTQPSDTPPTDTRTGFARQTAVRRIADDRWAAELHEGWRSLVGIHGGYTAAIAARAIEEALDTPDQPLRTLSAQFLRSPKPGPVEVEVTVERRGRTMAFASARVLQRGRTCVLVRTTGAAASAGVAYDHHPASPTLPTPPPEAPRFETGGLVGHFDMVEVVMDPSVVPFSGAGPARLAAWLRPLDGEPVDVPWLVAAGDVLPPALFSRTEGPTRAATIDWTAHLAVADPVAHVAPGEHVFLECRSPLAIDGLAVEDGVLWAPDGTVLAVYRQTRLADQQPPSSMMAP